jgi:hypothetical protein
MVKKSAKIGDILVINNGLMKYIVVENFTSKEEYEYILVNTYDMRVEYWSKKLDFKVGDHIFTDEFVITNIIPKDEYKLVHII